MRFFIRFFRLPLIWRDDSEWLIKYEIQVLVHLNLELRSPLFVPIFRVDDDSLTVEVEED